MRFSAEQREAQKLLISRRILADDPQPDETVVKEVLNYFLRNVQAADSLEGKKILEAESFLAAADLITRGKNG